MKTHARCPPDLSNYSGGPCLTHLPLGGLQPLRPACNFWGSAAGLGRVGFVLSVRPCEFVRVGSVVSVRPCQFGRVGSAMSVRPYRLSRVACSVESVRPCRFREGKAKQTIRKLYKSIGQHETLVNPWENEVYHKGKEQACILKPPRIYKQI